jgi:hypothetical protein
MPLEDKAASKRQSLLSLLATCDADIVEKFFRFRRHIDPNLKKPTPPAAWISIQKIAQEKGLCVGHLARLCRDVYSPQDLAKKCLGAGRESWYIHPEACASIAPAEPPAVLTPPPEGGATIAPTATALVPRSPSEYPQRSSTETCDQPAPSERQPSTSLGSSSSPVEGASS